MSHELLLVVGPADADARARRRRVVEHAAGQVPGSGSWTVVESSTATLGIVTTDPPGGSSVSVETTRAGTVAVLGVSRRALDAVARDPLQGAELGSEAGHVSLVLGADGSVQVGTDGTGFLPCYWTERDDELLLATHLASLVSLGAPPDPDEQGVLEYLVMLHPLRERTTLRDVQMLPAGGRLVRLPGRAATLSTRRLFTPSGDSMSDDLAVRTFRQIWGETISDISRGAAGERVVLGLSGGLDSRAVAVEAVRHGFRPLTYTYGSRSTREGEVASAVAEALELEHLLIPVTRDRMLPDPVSMAGVLDGAHSPGEMYELWFADRLRSFADVVVNGLAGGPLWGDDKALGLRTTEAVLAAQVARYGPDVAAVRSLLAPQLADSVAERIRMSLADSMAEWDMTARPDMPIFWKVHNRQFRWGNMLTNGLRRAGIRTEAPFLDARFLTFAARLTPEQRRNGRLYLRVQREVFGPTAQVPRSDDGNAPRHLDHVYWSGDSSYARQLAALTARHPVSGVRRGMRQAVRVGGSWVRGHTGLAWVGDSEEARRSVFASDLWVRTQRQYRERLARFLEAAPVPDLLSAAAVERSIDALRTGGAVADPLMLAKAATAQVWLADYTRRAELRRAASHLQGERAEPVVT